jgi:hypothetical protein
LNFDLLQLSGFMMEVIETAYAGHAKAIASTVTTTNNQAF